MSSGLRVDGRLGGLPLEPHHSEGSTLGSIIRKITVLTVAIFASILSFSVVTPSIALGFSAIVLLSSLAYALPTAVQPPVTSVYIPPPPRLWYSYVPVFPSFWRSTREREASAYHAEVGSGYVSDVRRRPAIPSVTPHFHAPVYAGTSSQGSPLGRTARPTTLVPSGSFAHGPVSGSRVSEGSPLGRTARPTSSWLPGFLGGHAPTGSSRE
jgi:hypothetical protein